jgi:hypothetical protein
MSPSVPRRTTHSRSATACSDAGEPQGTAALGSDDAGDALKRMQCPFALKDKDGKTAGSICFDGKN